MHYGTTWQRNCVACAGYNILPESCKEKASDIYQKAVQMKRAMAARIQGDGSQLLDVEKASIANLLRECKTVESRLQALIMQFMKMQGGQ